MSKISIYCYFSSISSKFGLNLMKKKDDGRFIFVDGLTALLSQTFISSASRTAVAASTTAATAKSLVHPTLALDRYLCMCSNVHLFAHRDIGNVTSYLESETVG